jgi:acetyltransferase-like isoleucine patch superfamily enzyme
MASYHIHSSAEVHDLAFLENNVRVWQFSHVREDAQVGENSNIGRNVYIGPGVRIGKNCKIQNNSLIYEPAILGEGVFIGPAVVLTNDTFPRAVNEDGSIKTEDDWIAVGVEVGEGASIGANSVCIAPLKIGAWSLIGSGSVVTKEVKPFSLVVGNPARQIGWVGKAGLPLNKVSVDKYECPATGVIYTEINSNLFQSAPGGAPNHES